MIWVWAIILGLVLLKFHKIDFDYNGEILSGIIILIPIIYLLAQVKNRPKWDDFLGSATYGMYLNHYLFVYLSWHFNFLPDQKWTKVLLFLPLSFVLGLVSFYLVDKNLKDFRKNQKV
ncbi:hypothetical protein GYA19_00360 [Candidatus Beckwithbacteria bacterium]|nr:hypothetical protein [Candidatus Beckwithbacteria bacterium]